MGHRSGRASLFPIRSERGPTARVRTRTRARRAHDVQPAGGNPPAAVGGARWARLTRKSTALAEAGRQPGGVLYDIAVMVIAEVGVHVVARARPRSVRRAAPGGGPCSDGRRAASTPRPRGSGRTPSGWCAPTGGREQVVDGQGGAVAGQHLQYLVVEPRRVSKRGSVLQRQVPGAWRSPRSRPARAMKRGRRSHFRPLSSRPTRSRRAHGRWR